MNLTATLESKGREERGAILILTALIMIVLLLIAAFATDLGAWYRQGQEQQRAADIASLNGIQAYDAALKQYIEDKGATSLGELSTADQLEAEETAMQAALDAITGALAAGGMLINDSPTPSYATPPAVSSAFVAAADGSQIEVTRTADNELIVNVTQEGTQYFSNFVRDAPDISRDGTAVISNCNADCSREIPLEPPFAGFAAQGNGDGFRPLIGDDNRVWLVNHLWDKGNNGGTGSIVCMDVREQAICSDWAPLDRPHFAANRPADLIDNTRNKIFYPGRSRADSSIYQIGCVNTDVRSSCSSTTIGTGGWGGGPWMVNDNIWAVSGTGMMYCIDPDNVDTATPFCPGYESGIASSAFGSVGPGVYVAGDVIGSKILMYHPSNQVWHCWDTSSNAACSPARTGSLGTSDGSKFIRYNTSGTPVALCFAVESIEATLEFMSHQCLNVNGTLEVNPIGNLNMSAPSPYGRGYQWSEGYTWDDSRMFMSFWPSPTINCYDWTQAAPCTSFDAVAFDGGSIDVYSFGQLNEDCLVAVGDVSKFFTFNPATGEVCTGSTVSTTITPCTCGDGQTKRYGVLELPPEIDAVLNSASAVIYASNGAELMVITDLLAGPVDLSAIDGDVHGTVELVITVDSKVDANQIPLWTEPFSASLALTVQPTLAR